MIRLCVNVRSRQAARRAGGERGRGEGSAPGIGWPCVDQSRGSRMRVIITAGCQEMGRKSEGEPGALQRERDGARRAAAGGGEC